MKNPILYLGKGYLSLDAFTQDATIYSICIKTRIVFIINKNTTAYFHCAEFDHLKFICK